MKFRVITTLTMALCLAVGSASASSIGVFFAPDGSDCDATADTPTQLLTWYICAVLGGDAAAGGVTGAEFRQAGTPGGWLITGHSNPAANVALGNPVGGGCNISFPACQPGSGGILLLYTVEAYVTSVPGPTYLQIEPHGNPSNPNFQCPLLVLCDAPDYTKICVPGGEAILNGPACSVGVERTTWGSVKGLYRD